MVPKTGSVVGVIFFQAGKAEAQKVLLLKGAVSLGAGSYTLGAPQNLNLDSQVGGEETRAH